MSSYEIEHMNSTELENEVRDKFWELEQVITDPPELFLQFGQWQNMRDWVDGLVYSYNERVAELDKQSEDTKKLIALQEAIAEVCTELMEIDDIEIDYESKTDNSKHVDTELGKIINKLDDLADESWEPYKKKAKTKKR